MSKEIKVYLKKNLPNEKEVFRVQSKRTSVSGEEDDYASYVETDIHMSVNNDGDISMSDYNNENSWIFIYADQLEHLQEVLNSAFSQREIAKHP
jgi:hypothetical protein